jgi:Phosphoribosylaminoimidazole carboxylase (NCAIR synthetase)
VIVARSTNGETAFYPVFETIHKDNICHIVIAPARVPDTVEKEAIQVAEKVLDNLKGAGVYAVEMFVTHENKVLVTKLRLEYIIAVILQ